MNNKPMFRRLPSVGQKGKAPLITNHCGNLAAGIASIRDVIPFPRTPGNAEF
jgi:hypothetical protein